MWLDSRSSITKKNKIISAILLKSRKRDIHICYTTQSFTQVDKRIRHITDLIAIPVMSPTNRSCLLHVVTNPNQSLIRTYKFDPRDYYDMYDSITGSQKVPLFCNDSFRLMKIKDVETIKNEALQVPCFDKTTYKMELKPVKKWIKHRVKKNIFQIKTRYGKKVEVTEDHSVFCWNPSNKNISYSKKYATCLNDKNGKIIAKPVKGITTEDWIMIPSRIPVIEKNRKELIVSEIINKKCPIINGEIYWRFYKNRIPNRIKITKDFLWLFGFFIAEGCLTSKNHDFILSSKIHLLKKAERVLRNIFGDNFKISIHEASPERGASLRISSDIIVSIFLYLERNKDWIIQLPKSRSKWFVYGFWQGDGYNNGKFKGFKITQKNKEFIDWFETLLLRFGIVVSKGEYITRGYTPQGKNYSIKMHTLTTSSINHILDWDEKIKQNLNCKKIGDLIFAKVKSVKKISNKEQYVYDFSVEGNENFIAENVCCKNTTEEVDMLSF